MDKMSIKVIMKSGVGFTIKCEKFTTATIRANLFTYDENKPLVTHDYMWTYDENNGKAGQLQ